MTNKEFDTALRQVVNDEKLPFDERNWDSLSSRLDTKQARRNTLLFIPLGIKQWAVAASLLTVGAIGLWQLTSVPKAGIRSSRSTIAKRNSVTEAIPAPKDADRSPVLAARKHLRDRIRTQPDNNETRNSNLAAEDHSQAVVTLKANPEKHEISEKPVQLSIKAENHGFYPALDDNMQSTKRNISLAADGGIAINSGNIISAGITVGKKISSRVSVAASIGYTQGDQTTFTKTEMQPYSGSGSTHQQGTGIANVSSATSWYVQHKRNMPYLQLSPVVHVYLLPKLKAGGGIDIQKLLIGREDLGEINHDMPPGSRSIPSIDPGVMLNLNYSISKRIGTGCAYRQSVVNIADPGQYTARNYFLFQLQYTIVK